jgi:hypothetical protein
MGHVFICYSRKDLTTVKQLVSELEKNGRTAWIDLEGIKSGELWPPQIVTAIKTCDAFLLVLSPNSATSDNVYRELNLAMQEKRRIVPVLIKPVPIPDQMQYPLAGVQRVDLSKNFDAGLGRLWEALGGPSSSLTPTSPTPLHIALIITAGLALAFTVLTVMVIVIVKFLIPPDGGTVFTRLQEPSRAAEQKIGLETTLSPTPQPPTPAQIPPAATFTPAPAPIWTPTATPEPAPTWTPSATPPLPTSPSKAKAIIEVLPEPTPASGPEGELIQRFKTRCSAQAFKGGILHGGHATYTYSFFSAGTWVRHLVVWKEGVDPQYPSCTDDRRLQYGFGKAYCLYPDIAERLGPPLEEGATLDCIIKVYSGGVLLPAENYGIIIWAKYGQSSDEGTWTSSPSFGE